MAEDVSGKGGGLGGRNGGGGGKNMKRKRGRNWDLEEILLLVQAKKEDWERYELGGNRDKLPSTERWTKAVEYLADKGFRDRDADQCKGKWDNLLSEFKTIKDWNKKCGTGAYVTLSWEEKKNNKLPGSFDIQVMDLLESFQGRKPSVFCVPFTSESRDGDDLTDGVFPISAAFEGVNNNAGDTRKLGAKRRGKKKRSRDRILSAMHDYGMKDAFVTIIGGMEKKRDVRFGRTLEFERERVGMEREDRKDLIRALGSLAKAIDRIAEKM